ncbi:hypothetical protein ACFPA8_27595 [Streptomyces ovatisporus]|uniref:Uncharacterized protein n=1 Tax=Streptomyces ovatisporus TaxID=1128682 RepID=A0ABV9AEL8_9ACTN
MKRESEEAYESARLIEEALSDATPTATAYRDPVPAQRTGAQPVPQPGRPPMSQKATDHASVVLAYSIGSVPVGGAISGVLWALSNVDPAVLVIAGATPLGLAGAVGVVAKMIGSAVKEGAEALPRDQHHHYEGPTTVQHTEVHTEARWFGRTVNQLPEK